MKTLWYVNEAQNKAWNHAFLEHQGKRVCIITVYGKGADGWFVINSKYHMFKSREDGNAQYTLDKTVAMPQPSDLKGKLALYGMTQGLKKLDARLYKESLC